MDFETGRTTVTDIANKLMEQGYPVLYHGPISVRVYIGHRWFVYSTSSGRWATIKASCKRKWHESFSLENFIDRAKKMDRWAMEQMAKRHSVAQPDNSGESGDDERGS